MSEANPSLHPQNCVHGRRNSLLLSDTYARLLLLHKKTPCIDSCRPLYELNTTDKKLKCLTTYVISFFFIMSIKVNILVKIQLLNSGINYTIYSSLE